MVTWSSEGNYRIQPTCGRRRRGETGSPRSLLSHSSDRALCSASVAQSRWDRGSTTTQTWRSCRKCHRYPSKVILLQTPAQTPPHPEGLHPLGAAASMPGSSCRCTQPIPPSPSRSRKAPSPSTAEKQQSWQGTAPRQQKAQASRSSSTHSEPGALSPDTKCHA